LTSAAIARTTRIRTTSHHLLHVLHVLHHNWPPDNQTLVNQAGERRFRRGAGSSPQLEVGQTDWHYAGVYRSHQPIGLILPSTTWQAPAPIIPPRPIMPPPIIPQPIIPERPPPAEM
jgi:hypothetical protein